MNVIQKEEMEWKSGLNTMNGTWKKVEILAQQAQAELRTSKN